VFLRSGPEHRSPAMLCRQAGSFAFGKRPVSLALHGARATPLPGRRWLRSSKTTHRTLARGTPTPKMSRALKTASIGLRRRELRSQTRSRIVPWPPSRQGYFAPASRDAILLDGSLPATKTARDNTGIGLLAFKNAKRRLYSRLDFLTVPLLTQ